jgi:hypothetical protein
MAQAALLRTDQVEDMEDERSSLVKKLQSPHIEDKGAVHEQLQRVTQQLETQRPLPYVGAELDAAVKREKVLRGEWTQGMLSQEEMRKSPPGAVDRHRAWEKRNIAKIEEWQNIQRRLHAGSDDRESASIENFRPTLSTMNMDGALIPGKQFFLPPAGKGTPVVFSDAQVAAIRAIDPKLADKLALLTNAERRAVAEENDI